MYIFNKMLVIVFVLQILIFITSISAQKNSSFSPPVLDKPNTINNATRPSNKTLQDLPVPFKTQEVIVAEGGAKMATKTAVNISQPHNREHVILGPTITNNSEVLASTAASNSSTNTKIRIHLISSTSSTLISTNSTTERTIPISEEQHPILNNTQHSDHKKIFARKGVNCTDCMEHKPKKPLVTDASEDEPFAPSNFQSKSNSSTNHSIPKVPNLDMLSESNQGKTQKYVVPIVIVILSVPFVAILISILYKRGAEWWKYRHYSRMDFLINGMYDN